MTTAFSENVEINSLQEFLPQNFVNITVKINKLFALHVFISKSLSEMQGYHLSMSAGKKVVTIKRTTSSIQE